MQTLIRGNDDGRATIVVDRAGQQLTLHTNTLVEPRPTDANDPKKLTPVGFLGVSPIVTYGHGGAVYTVQQMGGLAQQSAGRPRHAAGQGLGCRRGDRRRQAALAHEPGQHRRRRPDRR